MILRICKSLPFVYLANDVVQRDVKEIGAFFNLFTLKGEICLNTKD